MQETESPESIHARVEAAQPGRALRTRHRRLHALCCGELQKGREACDLKISSRVGGRRLLALLSRRQRGPVSTNSIAATPLGAIEGRVSQLDQLNRIAGIVRIRSDADTNGGLVSSFDVTGPTARFGKRMPLYSRANTFSSHQSLGIISLQQESRELFTPETCSDIAGPESPLDNHSYVLKSLTTGEMAVGVVHLFEMVYVHHQDAERQRFE